MIAAVATALGLTILYGVLASCEVRPHRRTWPAAVVPLGAGWLLIQVISFAVLAALLALAWVDRGSLGLSGVGWSICGCVQVGVGGGLSAWAIVVLGVGRTSGLPAPPALTSVLVDRGPYRYSRHPQYFGNIAGLAGVALLADSRLALAAGVLCACWFLLAARAEERWLLDLLGDEYNRYRNRVPFFL